MHVVLKLLLDWTGEQEVSCSLLCSTDGAVGIASLSDLVLTSVHHAVPCSLSFDRCVVGSRIDTVLDLVADIWFEMTIERASLFIAPGRVPV